MTDTAWGDPIPGEIDTYSTEEIVCPFCGYVFGDSWEYDTNDDLVKCDECGKTFELELEYSVSYTTQKPDWLRQWREYNAHQISVGETRRAMARGTRCAGCVTSVRY